MDAGCGAAGGTAGSVAVTERVEIRLHPTDRDLDRMIAAGKLAVAELVMTNGSLGADALMRQYMRRIYEAVVASALVGRGRV